MVSVQEITLVKPGTMVAAPSQKWTTLLFLSMSL
jgi:hypothetical protein